MIIHKKSIIVLSAAIIFLSACGVFKTYKMVVKDNVGTIPVSNYSFNQSITAADAQLIDTTALYYQTFDMAKSNADERTRPTIMRFESNGFTGRPFRRISANISSNQKITRL